MRRGDRVSLASDSTTEALVVKILGHDMVRVFWRRHAKPRQIAIQAG